MLLQIDLTFADFTQLLTTVLLLAGFAPSPSACACLFSLAWNQAATTWHLPGAWNECCAPHETHGAASAFGWDCLASPAGFSRGGSGFHEAKQAQNEFTPNCTKKSAFRYFTNLNDRDINAELLK